MGASPDKNDSNNSEFRSLQRKNMASVQNQAWSDDVSVFLSAHSDSIAKFWIIDIPMNEVLQ